YTKCIYQAMKDTAKLLEQFQIIGAYVQRYLVVITITIFALLCGYLLMKATSLTSAEPDPSAKTEETQAVARPRVEEKIVNTILGLEDRNVQVQTIFENARENPFME